MAGEPGKPPAAKGARGKAARRQSRGGPRLVLATGVFDILHMGHLYYLSEARKLGERLVVVVARDETASRLKRRPIVPEHLRLEMVRGLKPVDDAVLGDRDDFYKVVETLRPDIIALGHDQSHNPEKIKRDLEARGIKVEVVRLPILSHDLMATRRIIERILDAYGCAESTKKGLEELEE